MQFTLEVVTDSVTERPVKLNVNAGFVSGVIWTTSTSMGGWVALLVYRSWDRL